MSMELVILTAITLNLLIYSLSAIYLHSQIASLHHSLNRSLQAILQMQDILEFSATNTASPPSSGSSEEDEAEEAGGSLLSIDGFSLHLMNQFRPCEPSSTTVVLGHTLHLPVSDDKPNSTSTI